MNTYECMYIIQTNLSDEETDKANQRVAEEIEKRGGTILHRDRLGKKRLAYPIRKQDDGAYYLMYFEVPPAEIAAVRSAYRLHARLLRFLILRKEPEEIAKLQKRTREPERHQAAEKPAGEKAGDEQETTGEAQETGGTEKAEGGEAAAESGTEEGDGPAGETAAEEPAAPAEAEAAPVDAAAEPEPDKQE